MTLKQHIEGISGLIKGLSITFRHLRKAGAKQHGFNIQSADYFNNQAGRATLVWPQEELAAPYNGRYRLDVEIDDCIVCDKCAKVCPVDCIDIVPIKSAEEIGKTSDGSAKRLWAERFDIDMAKCCFCGLCTTVCPTECITMTNDYNFSVFDTNELNFKFGNLTEAQAEEKRKIYELAMAEKAAAKAAKSEEKPIVSKLVNESDTAAKTATDSETAPVKPKLVFKPFKPKPPSTE